MKQSCTENSLEKSVVLSVDEKECQMILIDHQYGEMEVTNTMSCFIIYYILYTGGEHGDDLYPPRLVGGDGGG